MTEGVDVVVEPEDLDELQEAAPFTTTKLTPSDHLTDFRQQYEIDRLDQELKALREAHSQAVDLHSLRKLYSAALFLLVLVWVVTLWLFMALQGIGRMPWAPPGWFFHLSDTVLVAYVTSTTASILGLFGIAAYWLFGKPKKDAASKAGDS